jgi:hypothetical protein
MSTSRADVRFHQDSIKNRCLKKSCKVLRKRGASCSCSSIGNETSDVS